MHESTICFETLWIVRNSRCIRTFFKFLSIFNVSSFTISKHKRDIARDPLKSPDDWKLDFLSKFGNYVTVWEHSNMSKYV